MGAPPLVTSPSYDGWNTFTRIRCGRCCIHSGPVNRTNSALHKFLVPMGESVVAIYSCLILMEIWALSKTYNSLSQSPCVMTAWLGGVCNGGSEQTRCIS
jgi:hypothetical protein